VKTITVQPLSCQFSNENRAMRLRPHQHFATVELTFETVGPLGFPVFEETVDALHAYLRSLTERPFRDSTNEDVADRLFAAYAELAVAPDAPDAEHGPGSAWAAARGVLARWGGEYRLAILRLAVRGVPDDIGHSDGFATYTVSR
jgi:hypothetical protein